LTKELHSATVTGDKLGNNEKKKRKKESTHMNINTHLKMKLQIDILEKYGKPTLKYIYMYT